MDNRPRTDDSDPRGGQYYTVVDQMGKDHKGVVVFFSTRPFLMSKYAAFMLRCTSNRVSCIAIKARNGMHLNLYCKMNSGYQIRNVKEINTFKW